ncbi:DUF3445 domain-containing protein [Rhodobacteraceae bacterium NNCM2]|nr:DUF3445 domain-containing protein [Coraliihabitans acroporae]
MTPPWLLDHAPYTPFMEPRTARPPGLSPMTAAEWTPVDPDFAAQMAYREQILARDRDLVLQVTPGVEPLVEDLYDELLASLATRPGYRVGEGSVTRPDGAQIPLDRAAPYDTINRLVADDFCILTPDAASGEYRLVAGLLCFPSRWLLSEKMGNPLTAIHAPVPDYDEVLAKRVNRVFEAIRPGKAMVRVNWLVHPTAELHLPLGLSDKLFDPRIAVERVYLRTERQTLTRLDRTGAVVFSIKTSICPLEALTPAEALLLRRELASLHAEDIAYRTGSNAHQLALDLLDQRVA